MLGMLFIVGNSGEVQWIGGFNLIWLWSNGKSYYKLISSTTMKINFHQENKNDNN
jgi:hypothetical protein